MKCVVIDQNSKSKKHTLISLELLQIISKRLIQNKIAFVKSVMAKTRTVEYNPRVRGTIKLLHNFHSNPCWTNTPFWNYWNHQKTYMVTYVFRGCKNALLTNCGLQQKKVVYIVYNFLENMSSYVALDQYSHSISPEFIINQIFLMISEFIKWDYWSYVWSISEKVFNLRIFFEKKITFLTNLLKRNHDM